MVTDDVIEELRRIVGSDSVLASYEDLYCYSRDASWYSGMPEVVVRPHSTEEVSKVLKLANSLKIPVVPQGGRTNLTGGAIPIRGGIVIDMTGMNRIIEISKINMICIVEAGVVLGVLEKELAKHGLFWPPDPASTDSATIGGILAEGAGGLRGAKYGTTRDWVLGLEVVLPTGDVINTGSATLKWSTGYDLTRLFIRSEGTLGVITKAILKLRPLPEAIVRMTAFFNRLEDVGVAVGKVWEAGVVPLIMELLDRGAIRSVNSYLNLGLPDVEAMVIIDVDGVKGEVEKQASRVEKILMEAGAFDVKTALTKEEMDKLYLARRSAYPSLFRVFKKTAIPDDTCVPISKLPEALRRAKEISDKWGVYTIFIGHIGDGNMHPVFCVDVADPKEVDKALKCYEEICRMVLSLGGTIAAEHGIGIVKSKLIEEECGGKAMEIMKAIKRVFDPNNIMNPDKWV